MYHLNTFHLPKNEGTNKCYGIGKIWTLTSPKNNLGNAIEKGFFFTAIHNHFILMLMSEEGREGVDSPPSTLIQGCLPFLIKMSGLIFYQNLAVL